MFRRSLYRVSQFFAGWRAVLSPPAPERAAGVLTAQAAALFQRMPADAQAHSLRVLQSLQETGDVPGDLAVAALLHDVGKVAARDAGAYLGLWLRGPIVLVEAWRPALLLRWASATPAPTLRYALYVQLVHPQIGAVWARQAGCSELACWLIEHHQNKMPGVDSPPAGALALLTRLQWADGRN